MSNIAKAMTGVIFALGLMSVADVGYTAIADAKGQELDPGSRQTGRADRWRILWVGGYRQQGVYQSQQDARDAAEHERQAAKDRRDEREHARRQREQDQKDKRVYQEAQKRAREIERERRGNETKLKREKDVEKARELEENRRKREAEQKQKAKQDAERKAKDKRCRGLGLPAGCSETNPGRH